MTFEEWWTQREAVAGCALDGADNASAAWDYQQARIDELDQALADCLDAIENTKWGYDGDCGLTSVIIDIVDRTTHGEE